MTKPKVFKIDFHNNLSTYFGGQTMTGAVHIESDEDITNINGIKVKFVGRSSVHWHEDRRENKKTKRTHYRCDELYFEHEVYVFGDGSPTYLPRGIHSFTFDFNLPQNTPSSFEGMFGYVRYFAKAKVLRGLLKFDYNAKKHFTLNSILDLNREPNAHLGFEGSKSKSLCCLCCRSGPISACVRIPRTGFASGQVIPISAEVDNKTNTTMRRSYAQVIQTVTYKARTRSRILSSVICEIGLGEIRPGSSCHWNEEALLVPALPPSRLDFCSIIDINYMLEFRVDPSGMSFDLVVKIPIVIGNIPILSSMRSSHPTSHGGFDPFRATLPLQLNAYPHLPSFSYEEYIPSAPPLATNEEGGDIEENDKISFNPNYISWRTFE